MVGVVFNVPLLVLSLEGKFGDILNEFDDFSLLVYQDIRTDVSSMYSAWRYPL